MPTSSGNQDDAVNQQEFKSWFVAERFDEAGRSSRCSGDSIFGTAAIEIGQAGQVADAVGAMRMLMPSYKATR